MGTRQECYALISTNPGRNALQNSSCTATCLPLLYCHTYTYANTGHIQMPIQVRTHLLVSVFNSSTREERHNSYYADDTVWPSRLTIPNASRILWCLRSLFVEIRKTQLHLQGSKSNSLLCPNGRNSILCPNGRDSTICQHGPMSTFNSRDF